MKTVPNLPTTYIARRHPATGAQVPSLVRHVETGLVLNRHPIDISEYLAVDPEAWAEVLDPAEIEAWRSEQAVGGAR
jgi:hypothetical protein